HLVDQKLEGLHNRRPLSGRKTHQISLWEKGDRNTAVGSIFHFDAHWKFHEAQKLNERFFSGCTLSIFDVWRADFFGHLRLSAMAGEAPGWLASQRRNAYVWTIESRLFVTM